MIRLLLAEVDRLRSRRVYLIGMILLLVGLIGLQVSTAFAVREPTAAEIAEAQRYYQQAQQDYQANREQYEAAHQDCLDQFPNSPETCGSAEPNPDDFLREPATFADMATAGVMTDVLLVALILIIVAASSIGAEYANGSIANWLSFVPNRWKVYGSKLLAVIVTAAVITAVTAAATLACTAVLVLINDGQLTSVAAAAAMAARGVGVVVVCAALGFTLALIARHTIAALGLVLGYLVLRAILAVLMVSIRPLQAVKRWLPENNTLAVLQNGHHYSDTVRTVEGTEVVYQQVEKTVSMGQGVAYLAVLFAIMVIGAAVIFRRRDIT